MIDIVIARYKENIDWIHSLNIDLKNIKIYNKFDNNSNLSLNNIGRESHTYLYHIIQNYDELTDYIIFLQGDPFPHNHNIINQINDFLLSSPSTKFIPLAPITVEGLHGNSYVHHPHGLPMYYFLDLLFEKHNINNIECGYGAQFVVHKDNITCRPKRFYEFLIKFVSSEINPIEGYIFERLWQYIFNPSIKINDKYLLFT